MRRSPFASFLLYAAVAAACAILVFPVYWLFATAISPANRLRTYPPKLFPDEPQWGIFADILERRDILVWLANSSIAALAAVGLSMSVSVFAAYSLSRFRPPGGRAVGIFILTSKMLPVTLMVIPLFVLFRELKIIGSLWSVILAHSTLITPFSVWMLKGYFDTIPREMEQAAMADGCSPLGAMFRVTLPASAPGLAATALYGFVLSWADFAYARTFLTSAQSNWTASVGIATIKGEYITGWNEVMAASLFAALPILFVYILLEKKLVGGLTAGGDK